MKLHHFLRSSKDAARFQIRFSHPKFSLIVLAASILLLPLGERASAQITVGGSNPISITGSNNGVGVSASSTVIVTAAELASADTVTGISVTFNSLNTSQLNAQAIALKAPNGTALDLVSGACNSGSATFTLADTGATGAGNDDGLLPGIGFGNNCPGALSGIYLPTDYFPAQDVFNSGGGGPASYDSAGIGSTECGGIGSGVTCGSYNFSTAFGLPAAGSGLQGTWTLYIATQVSGFNPTGSLGSWTITFTTESATATTTSLSTSNNGQTSTIFTNGNVGGQTTTGTPVPLTATVTANGAPVTGGTVTFYDSTGMNPGQGPILATAVAVNGSGQAVANVTFSASEEGTRTISAVFSGVPGTYAASATPPGGEVTVLTVNPPYNPSSTTFCNGPITIDNNNGLVGGTGGFPYPSQLVLGNGFTQLQGTIESVTLTLNGLASEQPNFLGFLLQAPNGNAFEAMSWADGSANTISTPLNIFLSDEGSGDLQSSSDNRESCSATSPCKPADDYSQLGQLFNDTFPAPAPGPSSIGKPYPTGSATFTSAFGGGSANGTWLLYANNWLAVNPPTGQLGSWCLNFTMQSNAHPTTTSVSGSPNPASFTPPATTASVTLTASVAVSDTSGLTVDAGTITFVDGATTLGTGSVSNGQATLTTSLAEGTHQIVASYSGTNTGTEFGISTGAFDQRVDAATANPTSATGAGPYTFCNTGAITAPGLGNDSGAASPYPSNIFVTNLPGTVNTVRVTLNGFTTRDQGDLLSLLVGPGGNNLDFFSLTGSNVSNAPSPFNLTFADGASSISGNLSSSGTFAPTSFNTDITYPQCPPNAPLCGILGVGPALASNLFTPTNKAATAGTSILGNADAQGVFGGTTSSTYNGNGTWSLYLDDGGPTGGGEVTNVSGGWCVALTQNLPSISATSQSPSTLTQGGTGSFPVTITNEGAGPIGDPTATTANAMTVTDVLPPGLTYAGFSGTDWSCAGGQTVVCTNQDTVAAGASYNPLSINVNVSHTESGPIGTYTLSVSDTEAANTPAPSNGEVTIDAPPAITSAGSTTSTAGIPSTFLVTTAAGAYPTATLSETGALPNGVMLTDNGNGTATLAGTPSLGTGGIYPITITAQNGVSPNATQNFALIVDQVPTITTANSTTFTVGTAGSFSVTTGAGTFPAAALSETGALPGGVTFTDNGNGTATLAGTPAAGTGGVYQITIAAQNGVIPNAAQTFTLTVEQSSTIPAANVCPAGQTSPAPCSATLTVTFNIAAGTTIGSVKILTLGATGLDFQAEASDTSTALCTAQTYPSATTCTVDVTFAPLVAGARSGAVQLLDGAGNVLATTNIYGMGNAPEIAFTPASQISLTGGSGIAFNFPSAVALDGSNNIFVSDFGNDAVYQLLAAGGYTTVNTLGGGFAFGGPAGVTVDGSGNAFVADFKNKAVYEILAAGGYTTVNTLGGGFGFNLPTDVAVDGNGDLFVSDIGNLAIYELPAAGGYSSVTRLAPSFAFGQPSGLTVDGNSNVYVSDLNPAGVYEIEAAGGYTTVVQLGSGFPFNAPLGVSADASGNVFVADTAATTVYEILAPGHTAVLPLGSGFGQPESVTVDALGNVYVPDAGVAGTLAPGIRVIQRSLPPALSFASTLVGGTSSDSPKSVQFQNVGNQPLTGIGALSDSTDFTVLAGPGTVPDCNGILALQPGAQCNVSFSFTPQSGGPLASTLTLTDNALNGNPATQVVGLSGTGIFVPQIASVSPNYGAIAAGINLTGSFGPSQGNGYVQVNGAKSEIIAWSNSAITIRVPYNGALGLGSVTVTADGQKSNAVPFTLYAFPTITNVSVTTGTPGTPVTITGTNLLDGEGNAAVTFNGTPATITSDTTTSIVVSVPTGATSGQLRVMVNGVPLIALANFVVEPSLPNITGISPNYGAIAASINLTGNFGPTEGDGYVQVNGAKSQVVLWSSNAIIIRVPYNGALGLGSVAVTADGVRSNALPFTLFAFPTITNVSVATGTPGTPVTITGTNLLDGGGNAAVTFNGTPATITSDTTTSIQVTVPAGATSGQLRVTVNGVALEALANFVALPSLPNITGISPNYGAIAASINVTGNFGPTEGDGYVQVNGAKSQVVLWSNSTIIVRAPYNGALGLGSVVVTADGLRSNAVPYTLYAFPTITNVSVTTGAPGTPVTITGTNLLDGGGNAAVTFNGTPATITSDTTTGIQVSVPTGATSGQLRVTVNGVALEALANFVVGVAGPGGSGGGGGIGGVGGPGG